MNADMNHVEKLKKLSIEWLDNFRKYSLDDFKAHVVPEALYRVGHDVFQGPEGFAQVAKTARFLYPNGLHEEYTSIMVDGNRVAIEVVVTAVTNKDEDYENFYVVTFLYTDDYLVSYVGEYPDSAYCLQKFSYEGLEEYMMNN